MSGLRAVLLILIAACGSTSPAPTPPPAPLAAPPPVDAAPPVDAVPPADAAPPVDATPVVSGPPPGSVMAPIFITSPLLLPADVACKVDHDCVVVLGTNCCDCSAMGTGVVVNRQRVASVRARIRKACPEPVPCADALSSHPTCFQRNVPVCVEHACALQPR